MIEPTTPASEPATPATDTVQPAAVEVRIPGTDKVTTVDPVSAANPTPKKIDGKTNGEYAQQRINRTNQKLRDRIAQLEQQLSNLDSSNPEHAQQIAQTEAQINTYSDIVDNDESEDFQNRAAEAFGTASNEFMEQTYKYAKHVNKNEPELQSYINAPYGMILLREWYKRMDDTSSRKQWLALDGYRKGKILDNFYTQIEHLARKIESGNYSSPIQTKDIPAARGGRQSNDGVPTDDFGIALQQAQGMFNRR